MRTMISGPGLSNTPRVVTAPGMGDFDAIRRTRTRPAVLPRGGSADSHRNPPTRDTLRRDAQRALRSDYLARSLVKRHVDTIVGSRISIQVKSDNPTFNVKAEAFLKDWALRSCDFSAPVGNGETGCGRTLHQMARLGVRSGPRDGDLGVMYTDDGRLQLLEAELIRDPVATGGGWGGGAYGYPLAGSPTTPFPGVKEIRGGVCFDQNQRLCGYSVSAWDSRTGNSRPEPTVRFVPASDMLLLRNPADDEVNLTRPEPGLTPLLEPLRSLRAFITDTGLAAKIALLFGIVTHTEIPGQMGQALPQSTFNDDEFDSDSRYNITYADLEPGYMMHLGVNERAQQFKPEQPTQQFDPFVFTNMALICADMGMPLAVWSMDFRQVNFSSAKGSVVLMYATTVAIWRQWLQTDFLGPVCRWRLAKAIRNNEIEGLKPGDVPDNWDTLEFLFDGAPSLDPLGVAQAQAYAINYKLKTFREVIESGGRDYEQYIRELTLENRTLKRLGISPPPLSGQPLPADDAQDDEPTPAPEPEAKPTKKKKKAEDDDQVRAGSRTTRNAQASSRAARSTSRGRGARRIRRQVAGRGAAR